MKLGIIIVAIAVLPISQAWAAQLDAFVAEDAATIRPEFKFLRILFIEYPDGGEIADEMVGKEETIAFTAGSAQLGQLIREMNNDLQKRSSGTTVTDVAVDYQSTIKGGERQAVIEYRINVTPTIEGFEVRAKNADIARIIDSTWRGFDIDVPITVDTRQYGSFDINSPGSALQVFSQGTYDTINGAKPDSIIKQNMLDASGIAELPLGKWHFLFDPTAIIAESKNMGYTGKNVVSHFSMGECNIEVGPCSDRIWAERVEADRNYSLRAVESQDDATISIEGFVTKDNILGLEVFGISPKAPNTGNPATDEFPSIVIYGMAGIAAVGGGMFFLVSSRKLREDRDQGQTGIDPAMLLAHPTSRSSGGYHTNRGEAHLREDSTESRMPI